MAKLLIGANGAGNAPELDLRNVSVSLFSPATPRKQKGTRDVPAQQKR
ncbi:hypothetical protein [Rhodovulum adriaticum]|nr:hypothetical protein [Rhodovulum adriaticum]